VIIIRIHAIIADIKCGYYPLSVYEVMGVLGLEIVFPTYSKYKKAVSIVEHYYSDHTC
jgi:hypothetical protein